MSVAGFQSSPSPKAGSYKMRFEVLGRPMPFQSSPSPKAGSYVICARSSSSLYQFQSSPSPKAGSYLSPHRHKARRSGFNPLPARRPGATESKRKAMGTQKVSILSQPEGRELLASAIFTIIN